jgi:cytochrome c553
MTSHLLTSRLTVVRIVVTIITFWFAGHDVANAGETLQYNRDVRPILAEHCFACHGLDSVSREADLRLDRRNAAIESGAIVPKDPSASELIARVMSDDEDAVMPPPESKKPLSAKQRGLLQRWVSEGAQYEKHWALISPVKPNVPKVSDASWPKNTIDHFVFNRLEREGLSPAPEANPRTLFRRLHLDITGLPPEPSDVDRFAKDYASNAEKAMSTWIDRLMESKSWGEHRGRYWLDAARYADTHGMHFDNYREMWPYRDWVIRSFNRNQPFDQFTVEQLAGDLLDNPTLDQQIATGFQRCNMTTNEGGTIEAENQAIYATDRVQTFGWVYLGLTTNCCQCHDHKFDPLTAKDYYSLAAFFRNTTQTGYDGNAKDGKGPVIRVPLESDKARWRVIDTEITAAIKAPEGRRAAAKELFKPWLEVTGPDMLRSKIPAKGRLIHLPLNKEDGSDIAAKATGDLDWSVEGRFGPAIRFKSGNTINAGAAGDFARSQPFSHSEWIRTSKLEQYSSPVARLDEMNKHRGWDLFFGNGQLAVHIIQSWPDNAIKVTTNAAVIKKDTWHHVAVTWDGSGKPEGITIYVDGKKQPTTTNTNNLKPDADIHTETPLRIGQRSTASVFDGSVQDFHLFDRQLSKDETDALRQMELLARTLETTANQRTDAQAAELFEFYLTQHDSEFSKLTAKVEALRSERAAIAARSPVTHVQVERKDKPAMANVLMRGQYDNVGEEVAAAPPAALHPLSANAPKNRLGLARWVVDPANPLTARVTVNRFWQELFGQGIVATPEDFGIMGSPPSHPELLDWLATDFVQSGWDVKRFFKQILMSATYRQAAVTTEVKLKKDRDNALLSRGPRFRMDAEMVRDYALTVSGLRSKSMFGPGVRPYQPTNIWNMVGLPGGDTREYRPDSGEKLYRRSLYTFWKRMAPPPSLEAFGAPNREVCTVRRERTNTPLQALVTLNDPQYVEAARKLAERSINAGSDNRSIANAVARRVLSRSFSGLELKVVLAAHRDFARHYASHPDDAAALIKVGDSVADDSLKPQAVAAWTMVCNQIMNLDEALNK